MISSNYPAHASKNIISSKHSSRKRRIEDSSRRVEFVSALTGKAFADKAAEVNARCSCTPDSICSSCSSLSTAFVTASALNCGDLSGKKLAAVGDSVATDIPAPVSPPPRWLDYGALGDAWGDAGNAAYDAIDAGIGELEFHRPYFEFFAGWDSVGTDEFEAQKVKNKGIRRWITVRFRGRKISAHVERYKFGLVIIKPKMTESPVPLSQFAEFKQAIKAELPDAPPPETWKISAVDLNFDLPVKTKRRLTFSQNIRHIDIHHYTKPIGSQRYLRLEAQLNGLTASITSDKEFHATAKWARSVILESIGITPSFTRSGTSARTRPRHPANAAIIKPVTTTLLVTLFSNMIAAPRRAAELKSNGRQCPIEPQN